MRRANRKDLVHSYIVAGLRHRGIAAEDMPQPGDILTYGYHAVRKIWIFVPMELKSPKDVRNKKAELTPAQARRANRMPIPIVHTLPEALAHYGLFSIDTGGV